MLYGSFHFEQAQVRARELFQELPDNYIRSQILRVVGYREIDDAEDRVIEYDIDEYRYHKYSHEIHDNTRSAVYSNGCGCSLCSTRHNYAAANRYLAWFKKVYHSDDVYYHFEELYVRQAHCEFGEVTEDEFYKRKLEELEAFSGSCRQAFKNIEKEYLKRGLISKKS